MKIKNAKTKFDVIVMGGGPSGALAAIAAGRLKAKTLLIEQHGYLGGALTAMGVGPMMSFHTGVDRLIIQGLPHELVDRLILILITHRKFDLLSYGKGNFSLITIKSLT